MFRLKNVAAPRPEAKYRSAMPAPTYRRYGIYFTPPPGPLARFGAEWLGWDLATGRMPATRQVVPGLGFSIDTLTERPRRYGFHATIKPPFRLAAGQTEQGLTTALSNLCAANAPVSACGLDLVRLGGFVALVPVGDAGDLTQLAAQVVEDLDDFRSEATEAEIKRRDSSFLSDAQRNNLHRWGYPHVMDSFRFHMTLTGRHGRAQTERTRAALATVMTPLLPQPFTLDALSLVGEDAVGMFYLIHRMRLSR